MPLPGPRFWWSSLPPQCRRSTSCAGWAMARYWLAIVGLSVAVLVCVLSLANRPTPTNHMEFIPVATHSRKSGDDTNDNDAGIVPVPLNPESRLQPELVAIFHVPTTSSIRVVLHDASVVRPAATALPAAVVAATTSTTPAIHRVTHTKAAGRLTTTTLSPPRNTVMPPCRRPVLLGRLSGPALVLMDTHWQYRQDHTSATYSVESTYHVPFDGVYFVEIIVLLCRDWKSVEETRPPFPLRNETDEIRDILHNCVVHPRHHRLTATNATIRVAAHAAAPMTTSTTNPPPTRSTTPHAQRRAPHGFYWIHTNASDVEPSEALYTRYIPERCALFGPWTTTRCTEAIQMERFAPYQFVWPAWLVKGPSRGTGDEAATAYSDDSTTLRSWGNHQLREHLQEREARLLQRVQDAQNTTDVVCLWGYSHSRELRYILGDLLPNTTILWSPTKFANQHGMPTDADRLAVAKKLFFVMPKHNRNCTTAVVAIGQWDASSWAPQQRPTTFSSYERDLRATLHAIAQAQPLQRLFLWNIHYNTLQTAMYEKCPAKEWRQPAFIDHYNAALRRIIVSASSSQWFHNASSRPVVFQYLDTSGVVGPQWDSASDTSHYTGTVARQEALYVAAVLTGLIPASLE